MQTAVLLAQKDQLASAYPAALREEIGRSVELIPGEIDGREWERHAELLAGVDLIFSTWGMPRLDARFLAAAPRLKAVFYAAGTVKGFATPEAYARGIVISSAWVANAIPVAEYSLGVILLSLKRFWSHVSVAPADKFRHASLPIPGCYGTKVGLLSLGAVGREVAKLLSGFELEVQAYDPHADPGKAAALGVTMVGLKELFSESDVVSIHAPWIPETENMVGGDLVRSMKQGATLLNTARGSVVNEAEVCRALLERPDITAILDVTHPEPPLPDSPLRTLSNVILTPHIAGSLGGEIARMGRWMVDEMKRFVDGQPLRHSVSQEMLARMA